MAGIELIRPIAGEFTRMIPGIKHSLTDVSPQAIKHAQDLISREDMLKRVVEEYRKVMPDEFIPVQGIARGEHNTLFDETGKPMLAQILGDGGSMDRAKQIHNAAQMTERQLSQNPNLNSNAFYNPNEGRVAINNPYDEADVGRMLDEYTMGIDYTQVHPLSRAIQEMTQKALQHNGITDEEMLTLLRKNYPNARKGNVRQPILSLTSEPNVIDNFGFNRMFDAWKAPINAYEVNPRNVMTSDLILPNNYGEREMQVAKQALNRVGSMKSTPGGKVLDYTEYDKNGIPMSEAFNTIDTAQFHYPKLINDIVSNPKLSLPELIDKFSWENGREPNDQEIKMMKMILLNLTQG